MSKGLEALKSIQFDYCLMDERTELIEKELRRLEELEKAFHSLSKDDEKAKKLLSKEIEKNRVLEIIKNTKGLIEKEDLFYDSEEDKYYFFSNEISKEKYDLLKEVLL